VAPRGPLPAQALFVRPASPLRPDTVYVVRVTAVRNVNGLVGGGQARLRTPEPAPTPTPTQTPRVETDSAAAGRAPAGPPSTVRPGTTVPPPAPGRPRASLPARGALAPARD
ncbi:MAG TPA: hypothetical protein VEY93_10450, partial [Longimicrobium sp.]|nr:hypothetical protein [Longimicrobium sp.]